MTQVIIQHHPSRAGLLERSAHLDPIVVTDPEPDAKRSTWRTYRECLRVAGELDGPSAIVQDDCLFVEGFTAAADRLRELRPHSLLAFCLQGTLHSVARGEFFRALDKGVRLFQYRPRNWVPAMALGWTPELARLALRWDDTQTGLRESYNSDDGRLFYFTMRTGVEVWCPVPCIVDHPDDVVTVKESTGGKRSRGRTTLALVEGDAGLIDWGNALS